MFVHYSLFIVKGFPVQPYTPKTKKPCWGQGGLDCLKQLAQPDVSKTAKKQWTPVKITTGKMESLSTDH
jgi:hypothetical protein